MTSHKSTTEKVPPITQPKPVSEEQENPLISSLKDDLFNVGNGFLNIIQEIIDSIHSIDYQYYYSLGIQFYQTYPITTIIILGIFVIAAVVLLLFAIYAFCRFFLFLSDHSDQPHSIPQPPEPVTRRDSIKEFVFISHFIQ